MASLTQAIGAFVAATGFDAIPPDVVARAKVSLVHNLAMAIAGRTRERVGQAAAKRFWAEPAEATLLHDGTRVSVAAAALANGALMHARSQDDTHPGSTSHPGGAVMPAALALAELQRASGRDFLAAVILGYEALFRVGRDHHEAITARGFRAAGVLGGFGAAAACAKLLGLSADQATHALGLVAHLSGGLSQVWREGSDEWPFQLGFAAQNGILAARLALAGATAGREILEGSGGFFRAYAGDTAAVTTADRTFAPHWGLRDVTVKPFPVCAILQGPLQAALRLARAQDVDAGRVARVALALNPYEADYPGIDNPGPFVSNTATKMSAQFSLAVALLDRRMTMDDLYRLGDTRVLALAPKVSVVRDPAMPMRESRIRVELTDGRVLEDGIDTTVGQPTLVEMSEFCATLARETGTAAGIFAAMMHAVERLDSAPDVTGLISAMTRGQPPS
jgi:2-methylcitrate dehydratase PrpD